MIIIVKTNKYILTVGIVVFICVAFYIIKTFLIVGTFFYTPSYEKAQKIYDRDKTRLTEIIEYFDNLGYSNIYITNLIKADEFSVGGEKIGIKSANVITNIRLLKFYGYDIISADNVQIHFQIWSNLDSGSGIVYSRDGSEPKLDYMTDLKKLKDENWYYYNCDYNKWRRLNSN